MATYGVCAAIWSARGTFAYVIIMAAISVGLEIRDQGYELVLDTVEYALLNVYVFDCMSSTRTKIINTFKVEHLLQFSPCEIIELVVGIILFSLYFNEIDFMEPMLYFPFLGYFIIFSGIFGYWFFDFPIYKSARERDLVSLCKQGR